MAGVVVTKDINAPVERVFDLLTDFENSAEVIRGIVKMELLTDGAVGVGTRFRETRIMFGREADEVMEVSEFERPNGYVLTAESHGCRYVTKVCLSQNGDSTRLEMNFDAHPMSWLAKMLSFMTRPMLKSCAKAMDADLDDIKASLESNRISDG